jgi:hypothetical protein
VSDKIFLITNDKKLEALEARTYDNEDILQRLLSDYPDLLAGYQMNEADPRKWLLIDREVGIPGDTDAGDRWSLDHLFLDQDGTPTLVEVKRASDTRIRREVVGQMFDYAANAILHWSPEVVQQRFEARCEHDDKDPIEVVADFLELESDDHDSIDAFWATVTNKLKAGEVRLVFVADQIPKELRRIIEFLNEHMRDVEVLGVELPQYVGSGLTTIVPKVIGKTSLAEQTKRTASGRQWDEASFFQELEQGHGDISARVARRVLEWAQGKQLRIYWGKGKVEGAFVPVLDYKGKKHQLFVVSTYGYLGLYFQHYKTPFDSETKRHELMTKINGVPSISLDTTSINRRPSIPLSVLQDNTDLDQLLSIYDWFLEEVRQSGEDDF